MASQINLFEPALKMRKDVLTSDFVDHGYASTDEFTHRSRGVTDVSNLLLHSVWRRPRTFHKGRDIFARGACSLMNDRAHFLTAW